MKNNVTIFGYESLSDFINTNLGIDTFKYNALIAILVGLSSFVTNYVYNDYRAVYFMLFALLMDGATDVWLSLKNKKFSSARLPRVLITMVFYCLLLCLSWNAAKFNIVFTFLPGLIWGGLMTTILVSVFENVYYLGYLPESIFNILKQRLRLNKILKLEEEPIEKPEQND